MRLNNNEKLYKKVLKNFVNDFALLNLHNISNQDDLKRTLHTLKGISGNIEATTLNKLCSEAENTLNANLYNSIHLEIHLIIDEVKDYLNVKEESLAIQEISENEKLTLLKELKERAMKRRSRYCKDIIEKLQSYNISSKEEMLLDKLDSSLAKRDYNYIIELLEPIIDSAK